IIIMSNQLNNADYMTILDYYNIQLGEKASKTDIKKMAEDILADKLCKCIKKVQKTSKTLKEPQAVAICRDSVLHKKGVESARFSCKKKKTLIAKKGTTYKLTKRKGNTKDNTKTRKMRNTKIINNKL
ncbi:MAG: hypothetical protein WD512_19165, partial [Candidatus Paceibacterota bacterium]